MDSNKLEEWIQWKKRAKEYLYDVDLIHKEFPAHTEHDHGELCWARFGDYPNDLKTGYYDRTTNFIRLARKKQFVSPKQQKPTKTNRKQRKEQPITPGGGMISSGR